MKWEWFLGGQIMFWISIVVFVVFVLIFVTTYVVDPRTITLIKRQPINADVIKEISETYVEHLGITIDKPIEYRFVKYNHKKELLGTFHEWNGTYYINISADIAFNDFELCYTIIHETRHMVVEYLRDKKIINLIKYTEEIANEDNMYYINLFNSGVYLLKNKEK